MARTSKRYLNKDNKVALLSKKETKYRAGIYTRLSQDRKEKYRNKSESIDSQIEIGRKYAEENDIQVVKVYEDYEFTGTNFKRPGFIEMMEDIKSKEINCIIVRDLSRFGREYLEIGNYIENIFPFLKVRFISVIDKVDSLNGLDDKKSFEVTIKNIMNDMYSKDISKKVRSSKKELMKKGYHIGGKPPFGYISVKTEGGSVFKVDEKVRDEIVYIFELANNGASMVTIARELNKKRYNPPNIYYKTGEVYKDKETNPGWRNWSIQRILKNEAYIGNLVQGRYTNMIEDGSRNKIRSEKEWIRVEDRHEAIIDKKVFQNVQKQLRDKYDKSFGKYLIPKYEGREDCFYGLLFCGICGNKLYRYYSVSCGRRYYYYGCRNLEEDRSNNHVVISEIQLKSILNEEIKKLMEENISFEWVEETLKSKYESLKQNKMKSLESMDKKIKELEYEILKTYEKYCQGQVKIDHYRKIREVKNNQKKTIERERQIVDTQLTKLKNKYLKGIEFSKNLYQLDREQFGYYRSLIDKIVVYKDKKLDVYFTFTL